MKNLVVEFTRENLPQFRNSLLKLENSHYDVYFYITEDLEILYADYPGPIRTFEEASQYKNVHGHEHWLRENQVVRKHALKCWRLT
ncbi:hypothetical protein kvi_65 [Escherichia phage kvi]|uniref:Uncharacterized protein n=1 Tax=Escherichia phage kvi TaxID=2696413 RepID=A0A6B9X3Q8_9CAUD|nr:hypothetical protein kvi_65 [Escherichia phage kvi]